jgi:hypothetical protein
VSHQAADEVDIAAEPIQFCYGHRAALTAGFAKCSGQLRATVKRICTFARLNLNEHTDQLETLCRREPG